MLQQIASSERECATPFEPIVRRRVVDRLSEAAARVKIIVAPAGFGKSVAALHYLEQHTSGYVRFALRRENGTIHGFLRGFAAAISSFAESFSRSLPSILTNIDSDESTSTRIATWLVEALEPFEGTFFVDDLHYGAADSRISEILSDVIERSPRVRWIVATRDTLDLPIESWIGYGLAASPITAADLGLTVEEAGEIASRSSRDWQALEILQLLEQTKGWPVAFSFALHSADRFAGISEVVRATRDDLFAFLGQQVLKRLSDRERHFLLLTAVLPSLDSPLIEAMGIDGAVNLLHQVRHRTALITSDGEGESRYHDLFQEFLIDGLKRQGADVFSSACARGASSLASLGRIPEALALYRFGGCVDGISELLRTFGFSLYNKGMFDVIENSIAAIPADAIASDAPLLALAGLIQTNCRVDPFGAEALYRKALSARPDPSTLFEIVQHYSALLIYPFRRLRDAVALSDIINEEDLISDKMRARYYSIRAVALGDLGQASLASEFDERATAAAWRSNDELTMAKVWVLSARVAVAVGRPHDGIILARRAAAKAQDIGFLIGVVTAKMALYSALFAAGELIDCVPVVEEVSVLSRRLAFWEPQRWVRVEAFNLAVMRGDDVTIRALEKQLALDEQARPATNTGRNHALALQATWNGHFLEAYGYILEPDAGPLAVDWTLLTATTRLVYAELATLRPEAEQAFAEAEDLLSSIDATRMRGYVVSLGSLYFAIGALLLDRTTACEIVLRTIEGPTGSPLPSIRCMARAIRAMRLNWEGIDHDDQLNTAISELRSTPLAGYARLLEKIAPQGRHESSRLATLTRTELQVLRLFSSGLTSRDVGAQIGRSALTIDSHAKAIARKLGCRGRREAIAIAHAQGVI